MSSFSLVLFLLFALNKKNDDEGHFMHTTYTENKEYISLRDTFVNF